MSDLKSDQKPGLNPSSSLEAQASAFAPGEGLQKRQASLPRKQEVKRKPSIPRPRTPTPSSSLQAQYAKGALSVPSQGPPLDLARSSTTRMPGTFGEAGVFARSREEDPATRFILKKKQPPRRGLTTATPTSSSPSSLKLSSSALGPRKILRSATQRPGATLSPPKARWLHRPEQDSDEESTHQLDVYGEEGKHGLRGAACAPDDLLRSGTKVLVQTRGASRKNTFDFHGLMTMQVIDPSLLGTTLVQRLRPQDFTGLEPRPGHLLPLKSPPLSHITRGVIIAADTELDGRTHESEGAVDSLMYLPSCNDVAIVDSLQKRFQRGLYFTTCDNMLIFVNPWESQTAIDQVFNYSLAVKYWTGHLAELPNHPYLVARRAFSDAKRQHRNQLVLTLGPFGCGQDRVHHELVKLLVRFALTMESTWVSRCPIAFVSFTAELARDAAVHLLEALHITHRGELFGGRLMDLFQVELDADGDVVGFSFLPNSSNEASQEIISWQMRQSLKAIPLPNIFYHVMYAIHFNPEDPAMKSTGLHPVDVTELLRYFPAPYVLYEDSHYEKCQQMLSHLTAIGLSERQRTEFLRIISAILVADVASYKLLNEVDKDATPEERAENLAASTAPRVQRITKQQAKQVEQALIFGQKTALTLAGLDIINLLATLLKVDETVLRDICLGTDAWQVRFLALKLFARLRWWLLGMISQSLRLYKGTAVHNRITLLKAVGLDFRHVGQDWALNQLLHNYTEECFLHLFATWAFTLDQATYLLEGVKPPPAHFILNDEILDVFAGPEGMWHIMREEHATRGGEAADDLSEGLPLAAMSLVEKILKSKGKTEKIVQVPGYHPPPSELFKPKMAIRVVKATAKGGGVTRLNKGAGPKKVAAASAVDPVFCQFTVVHTSGSLTYDATKFCTSDANAYSVPNRLRTLLQQSKMELVRTLVEHEGANDVIPTDCLRLSVANRLIQYVKDSLSEGEEAPQTHFIACVSSLKRIEGVEIDGVNALHDARSRVDMRNKGRAVTQTVITQGSRNVNDGLIEALMHEPQVPPRIRALVASEAKLARTHTGLKGGFDAAHVWQQLHDLQILTYCATRYLGMTVRLLYEEFLELYSILCIPSSYDQQITKIFMNHPSPRAASAFLLQVRLLYHQLRRIEYLERAVPAVTLIQRVWRTVRERAFVVDMRSLCIRVQSHARRLLLMREQQQLKPLKNLFWGAVVMAGIAYAFRRLGLSEEVVHSIKLKFRNREVYCLRWSAAVCVQSWWRSVMAQKEAARLRQAALLEHCSLLVQNAWRCYKAQAVILEKITEERIPNRAATVVQRHFRGWMERRKFQELRGLTMAFLSIQRKGAKLYSMRVMLNYRPIIRRTTIMRDMIASGVSKGLHACSCILSFYTHSLQGDFLLARRMVVKIQRWWRSILLLRNLDADLALPPPIQLPKRADSIVRRREIVAFELLRPHILRVQGTFKCERVRQECLYAYPIRLLTNRDPRAVYPRTWAQPLQDLLTRTAAAASEQQISYLTEAMQQGAPVSFLDIAIGGHHSLVLLGVRQPASGSFATRVRTVIKGGGWQDFTLVPKVYAWGWDDRGQLGASQHPRDQGVTCVGPLHFVDRVFRDAVDPETVAAGLDHSVALTNEGMAFAWGDNSEGQCGLGHRLVSVRQPTLIPTIRNNGIKLKSITAGPRHTGAVCTDGKALMWGASHFVRLPTVLPDSHSYTPRAIPMDPAHEALQVCCSSGFNVLRTARASGVFVWGRNDSGQLGQGADDKKSRDWPTFVALPATPAHPHVVSKVAVGTRFVVVSLEKKSSFLYTWGALSVMEALQQPASSTGAGSGPSKKAPSGLAQRGAGNPFFKFAGASAPQPQQTKDQATAKKVGEVKAVCKPTRVTHPLWKEDAVIDIGASGTEVLVLFESRLVHGYSWLEVNFTQRATATVAAVEERMPVQSFFFKKAAPKATVEPPSKEEALSCEIERLKGEFTLEPGVYSLRHLKPLRMAIRSIHTTGNSVSLAFSWAKAVRPTRQVLEGIVNARDPALSRQYTTASGAPVELPPKILERVQKKHKEAFEWTNKLLASPILTRENQTRQTALLSASALTPDPQLLQRMRSFYDIPTDQNSPRLNNSDAEEADA
ncbi:hypothetical protein Emag_001449 [Eimeria magna]